MLEIGYTVADFWTALGEGVVLGVVIGAFFVILTLFYGRNDP